MATKLKFVEELPAGVNAPASKPETVFTDEVVEELKDNPGKWAHIPDVTPQSAAAWLKRINGVDSDKKANPGPFHYRSVSTGKTYKTKAGSDRALSDVYVSYKP